MDVSEGSSKYADQREWDRSIERGEERGTRTKAEPERVRERHRDGDRHGEGERDRDRHRNKEEDRNRESRHRVRRGSHSRSRSPDLHRHRGRRERHRSYDSDKESNVSSAEASYKARRRRESDRREAENEDSEYEERRRRRKERIEKREIHSDRHEKRRRRETSTERTERKQKKKDKREGRKSRKGGTINQYGKYGIIKETDVTSRLTAEFRQWLVEERHINPETVPRASERKEMARFIEDFNTATMPSDKYYNLEAHERRMAMIRAGETVEDDNDTYDPLADEAAAKASFRAQRRAEESGRSAPTHWQSKEQLESLRRVQMERIEAAKMKQLGLETRNNMGVRMDGTEFDRR